MENERGFIKESCRIHIFLEEKKQIWFIDAVYNALFVLDKDTMRVKTIADTMSIQPNGYFRPEAMRFRNDDLIIVPHDLRHPIVIYDRKTKKIDHKLIASIEGSVIGAEVFDDKMWLFPAMSNGLLYVINLDSWKIEETMSLSSSDEYEIWEKREKDKHVYLPYRNGKDIAIIDCSDCKNITITTVKTPSPIRSMAVYKDTFWILPFVGHELYQLNRDGIVICTIPLRIKEGAEFKADRFVCMIIERDRLFLLPNEGRYICVYCITEKNWVLITLSGLYLHNRYANEWFPSPPYASYYREGKYLFFLPLSAPFLSLDLDTFDYEQKDIVMPLDMTERRLSTAYIFLKLKGGYISVEKRHFDFRSFLNMVVGKRGKQSYYK